MARLTAILHRYTQGFVVQIAQGNACNRAHSVAQRCARWLLTTHDRVGRPDSFSSRKNFSVRCSECVGLVLARWPRLLEKVN